MSIMKIVVALAMFLGTASTIYGSSESIGPRGIRSKELGLTGAGIAIGQVEPGRPGKPNFDSAQWVHSQTIPMQVYAGSSVDTMDSSLVQFQIGRHATEVAGVMIATASPITLVEGVAPGASLYASGDSGAFPDDNFAVAANRIATLSVNVPSINVSAGRQLQPPIEKADGNTFITQFIDWSAARHDVLYVLAGAGDNEISISDLPQDNFNGITVAASRIADSEPLGDYRQVDDLNILNNDAVGERTTIDIMAPGIDILLTSNADIEAPRNGTSFAAPHVTGTVALLRQLGKQQFDDNNPRFNFGQYSRHEVMKAVLLNSADKLDGIHGSTRNVLNKNGQMWTVTNAFNSATTSLDEQMGAGHLNAASAFANYETGEYESGSVPPIGWDFDNLGGPGLSRDYVFDQAISGYVAITLAWDRRVELTNPDNNYTFGDTFFKYTNLDDVLNNLDIYLLPASSNDLGDALRASTTDDDNLEHIFFEVPQGEYKIRVVHAGGLNEDQDYGLAWWAGEVTTAPGDFDGDGDVDSDDLSQWEGDFGQNADSDADGDGDSDGADFLAWQQNFGTGVPAVASSQTVPEPATWILLASGSLFCLCRNRSSDRC